MTIRVYVGYSHWEVERFLRGGSKCETTGEWTPKSRALRDHVAGYLRLADGTGLRAAGRTWQGGGGLERTLWESAGSPFNPAAFSHSATTPRAEATPGLAGAAIRAAGLPRRRRLDSGVHRAGRGRRVCGSSLPRRGRARTFRVERIVDLDGHLLANRPHHL